MTSVVFCPGRIWSSWVSLKFAVTQRSSGTNMVRFVPAVRILSDRPAEIDDPTRLSRGHDRVGEIEPSLIELRIRLREIRFIGRALRLQNIDLPLSRDQPRLRRLQRRLLLEFLGVPLLRVLDASIAGVGELVVARRLLLREHEAGLRLLDLRLVLRDDGPLRRYLRVHVVDIGLRRRHLRLRLLERGAIVAIVDAGDHLAGDDMLIVGDRDLGDVTRHLRSDRKLPRGDEGVVRRLEMRRVIPVDIPGARRQQKGHGADRGKSRVAAQKAAARRFALVAVVLPALGLGLRPWPASIRLGVGRFSRGGGPRSRAPGWTERLVLAILLASLGAGRVQLIFDFDVVQHHATPSVSSGRGFGGALDQKRNDTVSFRSAIYVERQRRSRGARPFTKT